MTVNGEKSPNKSPNKSTEAARTQGQFQEPQAHAFEPGRAPLSRRTFFAQLGLGSALAVGAAGAFWRFGSLPTMNAWPWALFSRNNPKPFEASIVGPSRVVGHELRSPSPSFKQGLEQGLPSVLKPLERCAVAIVGGGISGLAAAWQLKRKGQDDFCVLELERETGGNSLSGENAHTRFPWGAHYLPLPTEESALVREFLADIGVIVGYGPGGEPLYDEFALCHSPQERIYYNDTWHEGLYPAEGATTDDLAQHKAFLNLVDSYRSLRDAQGKKAFAIPLSESSREPALLALDSVSMHEFLAARGLSSERLRWFVEYGCRDDFGTDLHATSAWAALHYFASRDASQEHAVLTWPEGNGFLAKALRDKVSAHIQTQSLVRSIQPLPQGGCRIEITSTQDGSVRQLHADKVVFALPQFMAPYLIKDFPAERVASARVFTYAPWLVANLELTALPENGSGFPLAWDNILYDSPGLGYVVASHQSLKVAPQGTQVITYYRPFTGDEPKLLRAQMEQTDAAGWASLVLQDLSRAHPNLRETVKRIDVMLWAHGMVRPVPGFIWGQARALAAKPWRGIFFAHSDLSGMSLFEEALYQGVRAANESLADT